jgi:hypothetical protein
MSTPPITPGDSIASASEMVQLEESALPNSGTLTGAEVVPVAKPVGLFQTTLTTIAQWIVSTFQGFTQNGTGAISRTLVSKLQENVSILDFGADPTGTNDSTAAIQAAIATGLDLFVPDGTYLHSASLILAGTGQTIRGGINAIFKKTAAVDQFVLTGATNQLLGFRVNGNGLNGSGVGVKGTGNLVQNLEVYNQGISGQSAHGIYLDGTATTCNYNRIENNYVHNCWGVGLSSNTAPDNVRVGNVVFNTGLEGITDDLPSYRSLIADNQVINCCQTGGVGGIGIDQASNASITGNVISGTASNLPGIKFQNNVGGVNYCTVSNNSLISNTGGGIWLHAGTGGNCFNNVISANSFQSNTGFDIKVDAGCTNNVLAALQPGCVVVDSNAGGINPKTGYRCNFRAYVSATTGAVTGNGTVVQLPLNATSFNPGTIFNTTTYTFTAPITGIYSASAAVRCQSGTSGTYAQLQIVQAGSFAQTAQDELDLTAASASFNLSVSDMFAMQAGDTLVVQVAVYGGTLSYTINGSPTTTFFSVALVQ